MSAARVLAWFAVVSNAGVIWFCAPSGARVLVEFWPEHGFNLDLITLMPLGLSMVLFACALSSVVSLYKHLRSWPE